MTVRAKGMRIGAALAATLGLLALAGCGYDYLNHEDRVSYTAGDAVKANLEAQTENPKKPSMKRTDGLGKNGEVIPDDSAAQ